jgi:hypothetical protein
VEQQRSRHLTTRTNQDRLNALTEREISSEREMSSSPTTDRLAPAPFVCPHCAAQYKLIRVEATSSTPYREIICLSCGAPLAAREGAYVLKYFLVQQPSQRQRRTS